MKFQQVGKLSIEDGLALIREHMRKPKPQQRQRVRVLGKEVALNSLRLYTFATTPPCCSNPECTVRATHFAVEIQTKEGKPVNSHHQLNMYGKNKDGQKVLMTHDHTLARSLGGKDGLSNTSTMCKSCNQRKSIFESQEVERRRSAARGHVAPALPQLPGVRTMQYLAEMRKMAQSKGMTEDEYRDHCALLGTALGPPLVKWNERDRDHAHALGFSRVALRLYQQHKDQLLRPGVELVVEPALPVFEVDPATLCPMRHRKRHSH